MGLQLVFSLLAELIISSLVHQILQLVGVRQLTLIQQPLLSPPTSWTNPSPSETRSREKESQKEPNTHNTTTLSQCSPQEPFQSRGRKHQKQPSQTPQKRRNHLLSNNTTHNPPSVDRAVHLRQLNVHNITKRVLSVVSNTNNSGLSSSVLSLSTQFINSNTSIHSWSLLK